MATFREIREGIAANLAAIPGVQVSSYILGSATLPAIQVAPENIDYDKAFRRGLDALEFRITALVGAASDVGSQNRLDPMLDASGTHSVKAAVESDTTLGGAVEDCRVVGCSGYRLYDRSGSAVLGAEWRVHVWQRGTA